jgi:acyl-CoA reductase-like NAD-dependent aldehyde dehydrogenase
MRDRIYVDGEWTSPHGAVREIENPATEETTGTVRQSTAVDAMGAVDAARNAAAGWAATTPQHRSEMLTALRGSLAERGELLIDTLVAEVGTPVALARSSHLGQAMEVLESYAELLQTYPFVENVRNSRVVSESAGVVGAITPWNYPLYQMMAKVAPALAAGCTVVAKPADLTPLSAFIFADAVEAIGLPRGVFNLVPGPGAVVGEVLSTHPEVNVISFTGSTEVGKRVAASASASVKRVCLELGGKSASIVLPDANINEAVAATVANVMVNSGQTCAAWTRLLVPRGELENALAAAEAAALSLTVGNPQDEGTDMGPVISAAQRNSVLEYIRGAVSDGATVITGGLEVPDGITVGHFIRPTILAGLAPTARIVQEEVFGPVLVILPYEDVDEAIALANGTSYGLAGAVWGADTDRAFQVANRLRTGRVDINGAPWNSTAPFGGYGQSGNGRELGRWGLEEFLEIKSIQMPTGGTLKSRAVFVKHVSDENQKPAGLAAALGTMGSDLSAVGNESTDAPSGLHPR